MNDFIRVMKALSDPNRVRVVKLLQDRKLCVCDIQKCLQLAQSTVSRHMKTLEDAGLVEHKRQGTWIIYSLTENNDSTYGSTMLANLEEWLENDHKLQQMRRIKDLDSVDTLSCTL